MLLSTFAVHAETTFEVPATKVYPEKNFVQAIAVTNDIELTAFQCDIYIPEGLTLQTDDSGQYDITLTDSRCSDHTIYCKKVSNGAIRVIVMSMNSTPIIGTEGAVLNLNLTASGTLGQYTIDVKDIKASDTAGKLYSISDVSGTVEIGFTPGDVNNDGIVAVNDVVYVVNYILDDVAPDFHFLAADMDGNGSIFVNDVVLVVNTILGVSQTKAAYAPRYKSAYESLNVVSSSANAFDVSLSNASRYTAMQFDMELADGADIADIKVSMPTDHSVAYRRIDDTTVRVVVTSLTNEALAEGTQLCISMKDAAGKTVAFTNGRAACNNGQMVGIMPGSTVLGGTTGIDGVNAEFAPSDVYSIDGRIVKKNATTLDGLKPGVYVVNGRKVVKS